MVGLFAGDGGNEFGAVAVAGQAHPQIGVFGDVVGIPPAHILERLAAEEDGGAPQRDHQPQRLQPRQHQPEPGGVFDGEAAGNPVGGGVVEIEHPLQAGHLRPGVAETVYHLPDLVGLGLVLGVVDADDRAPAEVERVVHGPRLGLQRAAGHHDPAHVGGQAGPLQGVLGGAVLLLDDEADVEQLSRVVEALQPAHQAGSDFTFAKQRHQQRDGGVAGDAGPLARGGKHRAGAVAGAERGDGGGGLEAGIDQQRDDGEHGEKLNGCGRGHRRGAGQHRQRRRGGPGGVPGRPVAAAFL